MAQLIVRNLEDQVRDRLRDRAKRHGHSMEEEARDILRAAVLAHAAKPGVGGLGSWCLDNFGDSMGEDFVDFEEIRTGSAQIPNFE